MKVTTIGIDLAKNVIQVHGVDEGGKAVVKKQLKRDQVASFFANLPPCLIGMEACGSAHYWARKLQSFGHTVKLMAPLLGRALDRNPPADWLRNGAPQVGRSRWRNSGWGLLFLTC